MTAISSEKSWPMMRRIALSYLKPRWKIITFAMCLMALASGTTAAQAWLLEPMINKIFINKQSSYLIPIGLGLIAIFIIRGATIWGNNVLMSYVGQDVVAAVQKQIFGKLIRQDMAFFQQYNAGRLGALMISDVAMMRLAMADTLTGFVKNGLTLLFLIIIMFHQDWRLAIIAFVIFPPTGLIVSKIGRKLRLVMRTMQEQQGILNGLLNQSFLGIRQVKSYNAEEYEAQRIDKTVNGITKLNNKAVRVYSLAMPVNEVLAGLAIAAIVFYGGSQVINGVTTPGAFFSFIAAFIMAYEPMKRMAKMNAGLQSGLAAASRIFEIIDMPETIIDKADAKALTVKDATITFENVSFAYPDGSHALSNVSFSVPAGRKTALVGPSGSGKSTCLQLLLRFFDAQSGRILIDGQDIRDVNIESLRDKLGFVSQDVFIFDDSVAKNIAYGRDDATKASIEDAARKAAAHEFILQLENGYDTVVGEMGTKLSGGQKQRIAIARAVLKNAPLLLLDEATSALDNESEKLVTEALNNLEEGRTTFIVAHRLSTIRDADLIIVMDQGKVIAQGTHDQLMANGGLYPSLYASMLHN
jgi:subfamily B ATP-binding cassette protein MsbA